MRLLWPRRFPKRRVATIAERVSLGARRRSSSGRRRTLWVARRRNAGTPPARCLTAYGRAGTPTERYAVAANVVTCHGPALCSNNTDRLQRDFTSTQPAATVATTAGPRRRTACQRSTGPAATSASTETRSTRRSRATGTSRRRNAPRRRLSRYVVAALVASRLASTSARRTARGPTPACRRGWREVPPAYCRGRGAARVGVAAETARRLPSRG
jgi:hypothetical protein